MLPYFATSIIALSALTTTASAGADVGNQVRGYTLRGEILILPAAEQAMPQGWSLQLESTAAAGAVINIGAQAEVITAGDEIVSLLSQAMPAGSSQLVLATDGGSLALGDLAITCSKDGWALVSQSDVWSGRPVLTLAESSRLVRWTSTTEFVVSAELQVSSTVLDELGASSAHGPVVGTIALMGSANFDPARPVIAAAPTAPVAAAADVIVSTVGGTLTKNGTVGTITAYSWTTVSCNIGSADAIWLANVNQHPVIGSQMYRLKSVNGAKRFEQIGIGWLKHGFCALDAPSCSGGTYTPNGSCDWLGLFATDTYSASLNGSQSNLGPRSEVQPWTGAYPYPYILGGGATGNAIYKRVQVQNADLDPAQNSGGQYWGDVVYITTDEAQNSVRHNNYSHRPIAVGALSGGGYSLSFTGTTTAQVPAIQEWANNDAGTTLVNIDVPGDGRLILGYHVTSLGGGQYHYEYALFNMNSDRSVQAVSVPLPQYVNVTNVGFHDIDYHSGEPYSTTDWTPTTTLGTSQSWATQTHATNTNANALRWSTTYNYRFDTNSPPVAGNITLTLFKPGTPTTITVAALVPRCQDIDGDGTTDCTDGCPTDAGKTSPGACGCGVADTDSDGDGTPNCIDGCPNDPGKITAGICGCGIADIDSDGDGTANCIDGCPSDPGKIAAGICGCGVADTDSDGDGTANCIDGCPSDPTKIAAGACGCGVAETDGDGDGTPDCVDGCPTDPTKIGPGLCGCGTPEVDSDGDGTIDCVESCPSDPNKTSPGICGCGVPDTDSDGDTVADCIDNCPTLANTSQADCDSDSIGDACEIANGTQFDTNTNGLPDNCEACPNIISYCTAGTTTNGCNATMSASGTPSASATSGFTLSVNNVEGQKFGLLFYGINGPAALPWFGGSSSFLCVKPPTQRIPAANSGGTVDACDGSLSIDFLAYGVAYPGSLGMPLTAGQVICAQTWFRDPPAPNTTNLSNGLQFTTCP